MATLREEIRTGTLRRMREALAEVEDRLIRLRDDGRGPGDPEVREAADRRDALLRDIAEMDGLAQGRHACLHGVEPAPHEDAVLRIAGVGKPLLQAVPEDDDRSHSDTHWPSMRLTSSTMAARACASGPPCPARAAAAPAVAVRRDYPPRGGTIRKGVWV